METSNVHSLLHYADAAQQTGPLFHTSCFPLERFLGIVKKFVLGPTNPCIKIKNSFQLVQNMPKYESEIPKNSKAAEILRKIQYSAAKKNSDNNLQN
jgi:hypothetical protein